MTCRRPGGNRPPSSARRRPASLPRARRSSPFVFVSAGQCGAAGGTGERCCLWPPRHRIRCVVDPGAGTPQHRPERTQEKPPSCFGFRAVASAPDPRAPAPGTYRCLHPHRRPLPAPCSAERSYSSSACLPNTGARLRSALLGSTRLGPQAPLSPLGTACCTPPALCFSSRAASN